MIIYVPRYLKHISFVKGVQNIENPENVPTLILLDNLVDSFYSIKVSEVFTKGSHPRNDSLITQNLSHQSPSSRDISLINKYIVVFDNSRDKTLIVHLDG